MLTLLERREIEARIVGPLYDAFAAELGKSRAKEIISGVVKNLAREAGCEAAEEAGNAMSDLPKVVEKWTAGDALELEVLRQDDDHLDFNVTRCRFAEMYRRLGLEELGPILSCDRDGAMVEGFNPDIELSRPDTLMQGAECCDFRYRRRVKIG